MVPDIAQVHLLHGVGEVLLQVNLLALVVQLQHHQNYVTMSSSDNLIMMTTKPVVSVAQRNSIYSNADVLYYSTSFLYEVES